MSYKIKDHQYPLLQFQFKINLSLTVGTTTLQVRQTLRLQVSPRLQRQMVPRIMI